MPEYEVTWYARGGYSNEKTRVQASSNYQAEKLVKAQYGHLEDFRTGTAIEIQSQNTHSSSNFSSSARSSTDSEAIENLVQLAFGLAFGLIVGICKAIFKLCKLVFKLIANKKQSTSRNKRNDVEDIRFIQGDSSLNNSADSSFTDLEQDGIRDADDDNLLYDVDANDSDNSDLPWDVDTNYRLFTGIGYICDKIIELQEFENVEAQALKELRSEKMDNFVEIISRYSKEPIKDQGERYKINPLDVYSISLHEACDFLRTGASFLGKHGLIMNDISDLQKDINLSDELEYTEEISTLLWCCSEIGCIWEAIMTLEVYIEDED